MSNNLGSIYADIKNGVRHIIIDAENIELSGNINLLDISASSINTNDASFVNLKFGAVSTQNLLPTNRGSSGQYLQTDGAGSLSWASVNAVNVTDSTANTNFPVVFHNESNGLLDDTGSFTYNPHLGKIVIPGAIEAAKDNNKASFFGAAAIGNAGANDQATFAHLDNNNTNNLALKQTAAGRTIINAKSGQNIQFRINNSDVARISSVGNLGIGLQNAAPAHMLEVNNDISASSISTNDASFVNLKFGAVSTQNLLPTGHGSSGQYLQTNGSGTLSWASVSAGATTITGTGFKSNHSGTNVNSTGSISLGDQAGNSGQGAYSIAIGYEAGKTSQYDDGIAIGYQAGKSNQHEKSVAIGKGTGHTNQHEKSVAIGYDCGENSQGESCVAIGVDAGKHFQADNSVAIGNMAGQGTNSSSHQGENCVAIGNEAGKTGQSDYATAVGDQAGNSGQGELAVAVGPMAGYNNQSHSCVAIGQESAVYSQSFSAIAIGNGAGHTNQGARSVAIGSHCGYTSQSTDCVAIGQNAAQNDQHEKSVAIGYDCGENSQGESCVAIGVDAGKHFQADNSVAIGNMAGQGTNSSSHQGENCVAIGNEAGKTGQSDYATAVGDQAGNSGQGELAVAVGPMAGYNNQSHSCVAIGQESAVYSQSFSAIAIGKGAGHTNQGTVSVAIGRDAGYTNQHANSIILNASGSALNSDGTSRFFVKPIRDSGSETSNIKNLLYNTSTGEISHQALSGGGSVSELNDLTDAYKDSTNLILGSTLVKNELCNTMVGVHAGGTQTSGQRCTYIGHACGRYNTSDFSVAMGHESLRNGDGNHNTAIGYVASGLASGANNTTLGSHTLYSGSGGNNVAIGSYALRGDNVNGNNNIAIGYCAHGQTNGGLSLTGSNNIIIGASAQASSTSVNNEITLGNSSNNLFRMPGLSGSNGDVLTYNNGYIEFASGGGGGGGGGNSKVYFYGRNGSGKYSLTSNNYYYMDGLTTNVIDSGSCFDSTNGIFTAPRNGIYFLNASCEFGGGSIHDIRMKYLIERNGTWTDIDPVFGNGANVWSGEKRLDINTTSGLVWQLEFPMVLNLPANDKIRITLWGQTSSGSWWIGGHGRCISFQGHNVD